MRCADLVRSRSDELGRILSLEQGKVLREAVNEFLIAAQLLEYYAEVEFPLSRQLPDRDGRRVSVRHYPVGVVAAITPWNFPISLLAVKLAPALAAGCTVVAKPSPSTPMSTIALVDLMNEVLPNGVVTAVTGRGDLSRALSTHPGVRKISFTGSTEVGAAVMAQAAPTVKRVTLELGGNDPAIVLPDADLVHAARGIAQSAFRNAGQVCMAAKRVFVPRGNERDFLDELVSAVADTTVGHGIAPETTMGPMHTGKQLDHVAQLVDDAVRGGARIIHGGNSGTDLPGYFLEPTIVAGCTVTTRLVSTEQFGAALPVVAYDDLESLVDHLNSQEFGLGASVWTQDIDRANRIADGIDAGTVWVNQHTQVEVDAPFGGWKGSGLGRERGVWGLEEYLETKTVNVSLSASDPARAKTEVSGH